MPLVSDSWTPVVMDFTHTYTEDDFPAGQMFSWIDCFALKGTNCYCDAEAQSVLRSLMRPYDAAGIHFIDSGNYHYVSKFWAEKISSPFNLVLYDHHPDMQQPRFEGLLSCGGWVRTLFEESSLLHRVYIVGASGALRSETEDFGDRVVYITEEEAMASPPCWERLLVTGENIYLSIDKDVLAETEVQTNWDQGCLTFEMLKKHLVSLFLKAHVIGVDICGENPEESDSVKILQNKALNRNLCKFITESLENQ